MLSGIVNSKTTWGVRDLLAKLTAFVRANTVGEDHIAYMEALEAFKQYATNNGITSIGRNQFTEQFELMHQGIKAMRANVYVGNVDPGYSEAADHIKAEQDRQAKMDTRAPSYEYLLTENQQLKSTLKQVSEYVKMMEALLGPILSLLDRTRTR